MSDPSSISLEQLQVSLDVPQEVIRPISPVSNVPQQNKPSTLQISVLNERCVLEDYTQCSKAHIWKLMMSYYDRKGPSAWSSCVVPNFITCNSFIGKCYAKILHGYIQDCMEPGSKMPLDVNEPLYIVELGVGSGKFTFLMLQALEEMQKVCKFPLKNIKYIMTDFTEANFKYWLEHPNLKVNYVICSFCYC